MLFDDKLDEDVRALVKRWDSAEERIKGAEQIREGEVVSSSIFELRYAGRKLIDVLKLALDCSFTHDAEKRKSAVVALAEASECCIKAKHDALDAIITFLTLYFKNTKTKLDVRLIQKYFPTFLEDTAKIRGVQLKIAASRRDRAEKREEIYEKIYSEDFPALLSLFEKITSSSDIVEAEIEAENRRALRKRIYDIVMFAFGALGFLDVVVRLAHH